MLEIERGRGKYRQKQKSTERDIKRQVGISRKEEGHNERQGKKGKMD